MQKYGFIEEGGGDPKDPSYFVGDMSLTDYLNYIGSVEGAQKEHVAEVFSRIIHRGLNGSPRDQIYARNMLGSMARRYDTMQDFSDLKTDKDIERRKQQIASFDYLLEHLKNRVPMAESLIQARRFGDHENEDMEEQVRRTLYYEQHLKRPEYSTEDEVLEELEEQERKGKKIRVEQLQKINPRDNAHNRDMSLAHRLSRMFLASKFYDETFRPMYAKYKTDNPKSNWTYDQWLERTLNPAQLQQYYTSRNAANWLSQQGNGNILDIMNTIPAGATTFYKFGKVEGKEGLYNDIESQNLINIIQDFAKNYPKEYAQEKDAIQREFLHQMGGRKEQYWAQDANTAVQLMAGFPIDSRYHFYNGRT